MKLFKKREKLEVKENPIGNMLYSAPYYRGAFVGQKLKAYYDDGYRSNPTMRRCVDLIAKSCADIDIELYKEQKGEKKEIEDHPALTLLNNPNKTQSRKQFLFQLFVDELVTGNNFLIGDGINENAPPIELNRMNPINVEVFPADTGLVKSYKYRGLNGSSKEFPSNPITGASQVFHFYNPTYEDAFFGEPRAMACATWIDVANEGAKWNAGLLQNGAAPSGALFVDGEITTEQRTKLAEVWESRNTGSRNAGKPLLLSAKMKWQEMGISPKDMDFQASLNYADRKIADAFGVPFPLISPDAATFANMDTARESLYEDVIIPYFNLFLERFGRWLLSKYPDTEGMYFKADYDDIPAFEDKRARKYDRAAKAVADGLLSINEAREMFDYEPVEGGDTILVNAGKIPLTVAVDEDLSNDSQQIDKALNEPSEPTS